MGMLSRVQTFYRRHGALKLVARCFEPLGFKHRTHTFVFLSKNMKDHADDLALAHELEVATIEDVRREPDYFDGWYGKRQAIKRLRKGFLLFVIRHDGRMASFMWAEPRRAGFRPLDAHFDLPADMAYSAAAYTPPALRNRGLSYAVRMLGHRALRDLGYQRLITLVNPTNEVGLHLVLKLGFRPYQTVHYERRGWVAEGRVESAQGGLVHRFAGRVGTHGDLWKTFLEVPGPTAGEITVPRGS